MIEIGKTWSLGGIKIAVTDDSLDYPKNRFVKHAVLDTLYTDIQWFGSGETLRDVRGVLLEDQYNNLVGLVGSGYHTFVSDQGTEGDYFVSSITSERIMAVNHDIPVYKITVKLRKELA